MTNPPSEFPASPSQPDAGGPTGVPQPQNPQPPLYPQTPQQPPTYSQPSAPQAPAYPPAGGPPQAPQYAQGQQYPQPPQGPVTPKGLAITALILGIAALIFAWVPFLGFILGAVGVILGIMALVKKQPKGLGLTGLILSAVAVIAGLIVTIIAAVALFSFGAAIEELETAPTQIESPSMPSESTPETEPDSPVMEDFPEVSAAELAEIVSDPDAWAGTDLTLFGTVVQYDEGTGLCSIRLFTGHAAETDPELYEHNTLAYAGDWESDCPVLDPVYVDDNVAMAVTVLGEEVYETSAGESISALQVELWAVEVL